MLRFFDRMIDSRDTGVAAHLVLVSLATLALIGLAIYHVVVLKNPFDPSIYGQGMGWMLGGTGVAAIGQGVQNKSEKGAKDESDQ